MLWHYPQKYTVVSVTRSPLFESDTTYEQLCRPPCSRFSSVHSAANQQRQSLTFPHLFLLLWLNQEDAFQSTLPVRQRHGGVSNAGTVQPLFSHLRYQNRHLTLCIHSASAGGCRAFLQGLTDGSASLKAVGRDEREKSISQHTV